MALVPPLSLVMLVPLELAPLLPWPILVPLLLLFFVGIPVFVVWGKRAFDRSAMAALESIYRSAERQARAFGPSTPVVSFTYHTYSGLLLYVTQSEHNLALPARVAERALHDLLMHTVKYGFFAYGAALIPLLAYVNYLAQLRSIRQQEASLPRRLPVRPGAR